MYEVDDYRLPDLFICAPANDDRRTPPSRRRESQAAWERTRATQGYGQFNGWVTDWTVQIEPAKPILEAGEEITVKVSIESKRPDFMGRKAFNIHVFAASEREHAQREYVGGVTLYVKKQ